MTTLGIQATSCSGEQLQVASGIYHLDMHGVINGNSLTAVEHVNAQHFKLVGAATGTTYTGSVSYNQSFNTTFTNGKFVTKETQSILLTTPGGKNNVMVKRTFMKPLTPMVRSQPVLTITGLIIVNKPLYRFSRVSQQRPCVRVLLTSQTFHRI
jgi:hypothetical protein